VGQAPRFGLFGNLVGQNQSEGRFMVISVLLKFNKNEAKILSK
jgi:hypothetical protein